MNEGIIVQFSEIILAITAILVIIIVLMATWHDAKRIKDKQLARAHRSDEITFANLAKQFSRTSKHLVVKALSRNTSAISSNTLRTNLMKSLAVFILSLSLLFFVSYFFYTAATMRSNTLLTLSWALLSLWLVAAIWFDDALQLTQKVALTFCVPFAYFLIYARLFYVLFATAGQIFSHVSLPKNIYKSVHAAILQEAYSTRF